MLRDPCAWAKTVNPGLESRAKRSAVRENAHNVENVDNPFKPLSGASLRLLPTPESMANCSQNQRFANNIHCAIVWLGVDCKECKK